MSQTGRGGNTLEAPVEEACQDAIVGRARRHQSASMPPVDAQDIAQGSETLRAER